MLEAVNRKVEHLRFIDPISDFLYPFYESRLIVDCCDCTWHQCDSALVSNVPVY